MPLHFLVDSGSAIIVISAGTSVEVKAKCIHCEMLCVNICNSQLQNINYSRNWISAFFSIHIYAN